MFRKGSIGNKIELLHEHIYTRGVDESNSHTHSFALYTLVR